MENPLIVALDVDSLGEAKGLVKKLKASAGHFKVGYQLFMKEGPAAVEMVKKAGGRVFLDLKFHDIPRTVEAAARQCVRLGVDMFNVHAAGGVEMMKAAVQGAGDEAARLKLIPPVVLGVTVLTSLDEEAVREIGYQGSPPQLVLRFCGMVRQAGLNGVVASALEARDICSACRNALTIVTPGIRSASAPGDDQKRTGTPAAAIAAGADYIVVGRPILQAPDPAAAAAAMLEEANAALRARSIMQKKE